MELLLWLKAFHVGALWKALLALRWESIEGKAGKKTFPFREVNEGLR